MTFYYINVSKYKYILGVEERNGNFYAKVMFDKMRSGWRLEKIKHECKIRMEQMYNREIVDWEVQEMVGDELWGEFVIGRIL